MIINYIHLQHLSTGEILMLLLALLLQAWIICSILGYTKVGSNDHQ